MAVDDGRGRRSHQAAAVILVLCALAQSLTCFSLRGLSKKQNEALDEATVMEVRTGRILLNGNDLNSQSGSAAAAVGGNDGLLHSDSDQSDGTGMLEQMSQLEQNMADEAALRRLNPSLHCGHSKMKVKAVGPGADDLQLDMGGARRMPLIQVPETCGYSMRQNALGLVLVVPYDGCNVIQEDGNYVLPMSWLETPLKFACPMSTTSATTPASTTPKPAQQPWAPPLPPRPLSLNRHKRHVPQPLSIYDPNAYYSYLYNYYYHYMYMTPAPGPGAATTTAKPDVTTKPSTEKPQVEPPAYPYYPYPYYPYYQYYPYYPLPSLQTTTAKPQTTGPVTSGMTTTAKKTTTASTPTTKTTQKPPMSYYPPYFLYYPFYQPGQQIPGTPDVYYHPIIQHFYGKPPYPQNPNQPTETTAPPTLTTAKPGDKNPTKPTTASAPTTKACSRTTKPSSDVYPGSMSPYVPYYQLPFAPQISYNKAAKLPFDQKHMPHAGYKSGLQAGAPPHPGFNYWQPVPWFPQSTDKDNLQFDLKLPKHV